MLVLTLLLGLLDVGGDLNMRGLKRQTGTAEGYTDRVSREKLCERAADGAWDLVWRSCQEPAEVGATHTSACATVDYRPAREDGRGPFLRVRVQVEYECG